jgi:hypothetical protein
MHRLIYSVGIFHGTPKISDLVYSKHPVSPVSLFIDDMQSMENMYNYASYLVLMGFNGCALEIMRY